MKGLESLKKYISITNIAFNLNTGTVAITFSEKQFADMYANSVEAIDVMHKVVYHKLSEFELDRLWIVERTARRINRYAEEALAKASRYLARY